MERPGRGGLSVTDLIACILGAAVGSLHLRGSAGEQLRTQLPGLFGLVFLWVSLSATGPLLELVRRWVGRRKGSASIWEGLWALLGTPWLLTAPLRAVGQAHHAQALLLYRPVLVVGVGLTTATVLVIVWSRWVRIAGRAGAGDEDWSWSGLIGCVLVIAWPLQWGLSLVLTAP